MADSADDSQLPNEERTFARESGLKRAWFCTFQTKRFGLLKIRAAFYFLRARV